MSWPIKVIITRFLPPRSSWPIKLQVHYERVFGRRLETKLSFTRRFGGKRCKPLPFPFVSFSPSLIEVAMASSHTVGGGTENEQAKRGRTLRAPDNMHWRGRKWRARWESSGRTPRLSKVMWSEQATRVNDRLSTTERSGRTPRLRL
jgi:hypothetical protein